MSERVLSKPVSDDMQKVLTHLAAIPDAKREKAIAIQTAALGQHGTGPAKPLGMWHGGCYYIEAEDGEIYGKGRRWHLYACVA